MNVQVNAPFQVNDYLQSVIDEKFNKLDTYIDRIIEAEVYLKIGEKRHRQAEDQIAEIRLHVPGHTFFAEAHTESFEKSVASAAEKVARQIRKYKAQHLSHH
jgi:putative sigma-54 modulation protein